MEQTRRMNFPICGQIQHGIQEVVNNKKKVKELGYFIAKVKDDNLKFLLNRFNERLEKKSAITIRFFDEEPLTIKQIRYNQGGTVCYCMDGETQAKQKIQNKWTQIECKEDCQYRIKTGPGRAMCNEEGTLKFMIPDICTDKIWYMKITGYTSIEILRDYINFQKQLGNSLIGDYVIFLKEVEQINFEGKKFKNKILDIVKKEEFISNNEIISSNQTNLQNQSNQTQLSTEKVENVENNTKISKVTEIKSENIQNNIIEESKETKVKNIEQKGETTEKKVTKKATKTKKVEKKEVEKSAETQEEADMNAKFERYHVLINTETKILTKDGKPTEYLFATFSNTDDKTVEVIIPPQYAQELKECNLGTTVLLDLQTKGDKTFTNNIEYIEKYIKDVAA